jgi:hypothetical protein
LATKQAIYQALVPVAYPVLYDLGWGIHHAADWICDGGGVAYSKNLFQHTDGGAELTYVTTTAPNYGFQDVIAVDARHAVDRLHSAYIPAPPDSLTGQMFRSPDSPQGDGVGLYKLQFYSPQNFQLFPEVLRDYMDCTHVPNPPGNAAG